MTRLELRMYMVKVDKDINCHEILIVISCPLERVVSRLNVVWKLFFVVVWSQFPRKKPTKFVHFRLNMHTALLLFIFTWDALSMSHIQRRIVNGNKTGIDRILMLSDQNLQLKLAAPDTLKILQASHWTDYEPFSQVNDAWNLFNNNDTCTEPLTWYLKRTNHNDQHKTNVLILSKYFLTKHMIAKPRIRMCITFKYAAINGHWYWIEWVLSHHKLNFEPTVAGSGSISAATLLHRAVLNDNIEIVKLLVECTNIDISVTDYYVCSRYMQPLIL